MTRSDRGRTSATRAHTSTVSVTCLNDGMAHDVPDAELVEAASRGHGFYLAVCGHMVTAASMVEPDGTPCRLCAAV